MAGGPRVARLITRGFRNLDSIEVELGPEVTVVHGPNGVGKTNLLEAVYVGLVGRSCRTSRDRDMIEFGASLARVELAFATTTGRSARALCSIARDGERRHRFQEEGGRSSSSRRPPVCVFLPDRLTIVKGPPAVRRGHLDGLVAALWPARAKVRAEYGQALAQRNALLGRVRAGRAPERDLDSWDIELAARGTAVIAARGQTAAQLGPAFTEHARELGLEDAAELRYAPRADPQKEAMVAELRERRAADLQRGFTTHGPHLDELELQLGGRPLRRFGSQGQHRVALLALLLAERQLLATTRGHSPVLLLDDVTSELDPERRALLIERLGSGGQTLITATEAAAVPMSTGRHEIALGGDPPLRAVA